MAPRILIRPKRRDDDWIAMLADRRIGFDPAITGRMNRLAGFDGTAIHPHCKIGSREGHH
jgi:light-regulated signal transduction histidine kinase (bacteriophytochrome)